MALMRSQEFSLIEQRYEFEVFAVKLNHQARIVELSGVDGAGGSLRVSFDHLELLDDTVYRLKYIIEEADRDAERRRKQRENEKKGMVEKVEWLDVLEKEDENVG